MLLMILLIPLNRKDLLGLKFNGLNVIYKHKGFRSKVMSALVKNLLHIKTYSRNKLPTENALQKLESTSFVSIDGTETELIGFPFEGKLIL